MVDYLLDIKKEISENVKKATSFPVEAFKENIKIMNGILNESMNSSFQEVINNIQIMVGHVQEVLKYSGLTYFRKIDEIGWIPSLYLDEKERRYIIDLLQDMSGDNINKANEFIISCFDKDTLEDIFDSWSENNYITPKRLEFLRQAIDCYNLGYYAASVSVITCQLGGVIKDTEKYFKSIQTVREDINTIESEQKKKIGKKFVYSEKNTLDRVCNVAADNSDFFVMIDLINKYIKKYVYCSSNNCDENTPNRHGICHGSLLNYNTQEHALKSILIIDSIIRLYVFIDLEEEKEI